MMKIMMDDAQYADDVQDEGHDDDGEDDGVDDVDDHPGKETDQISLLKKSSCFR